MTPDLESAAAGDGGGARSCRILIVGFGNTLRRDDGAGTEAARLLAADARLRGADIDVQERYQLLPEMALDIGEATLVIFVDADMRGLPGSIEVHPIDPDAASRGDADARAEPGASSHHVGGGELVALAAQLTGHRPDAVAIGIGVTDIELGEGLSAAVAAALPKVLDIVVGLVERHRAAFSGG